jgi:hypothetical protein
MQAIGCNGNKLADCLPQDAAFLHLPVYSRDMKFRGDRLSEYELTQRGSLGEL